MLEVREELLTIAEISIGIAGFSGVMAVFLQQGGLHIVDRLRFINLFTTAFSTLVLTFVPIAFSHAGVQGERLWVYSSLVMTFAWALNSSLGARMLPYLREHVSHSLTLPRTAIIAPGVLNLVAQVLNVGGWFWEPGFLAYLFGLIVYMYAAGLMFVYVVLFRPHE